MGCSISLLMCGCKSCSKNKSVKSKQRSSSSNTSHDSQQLLGRNVITKADKSKQDNNNQITCKLPACNETPTQPLVPCVQKMEPHGDQSSPDMVGRELHVGSMKISKPQLKALLVFRKEDSQTLALERVLTKHCFQTHMKTTSDDALDIFSQHQHHLVFIDCRDHSLDVNMLCRSIRGKYLGNFSTIVAMTRRRSQIDSISSIRESLDNGFSRVLHETVQLDALEDEILQLESGHLAHQIKFRSCQGIFTALERSRDCVQITDQNHQIQYVNRMYEQVTGYSSKQVLGSKFSDLLENARNEEDIWLRIKDEIQDAKEWTGFLYLKSKSGEDIHVHMMILPICVQDGSPPQYVVVGRVPAATSNFQDLTHIVAMKRKNSYEMHRRASGTADQLQIRRLSGSSSYEGEMVHRRNSSLAKIHSMAIEAPITQIINLINMVKESSHSSVTEVLDQILEILRNSELYSPADLQNRTRDPMLTDFVEGLVTGTGFGHRRSSGGENILGRGGTAGSPSGKSAISNSTDTDGSLAVDPEIAVYLENIDSWDYDILALERVTVKKALVHFGMHALDQFNACDVLHCSRNTLHQWLSAIEGKYHASNTYHNSTHAADVLHATAYFLKKERLKNIMDPSDEVAALIAAIIHDVDHPGRTNAFLINSSNPLALLYNDTAVLESHHAAFAFKFTVNNEKCNIFKNMSSDNFMALRQSIIDMVLATELSKHFEHVNKFISIVTKYNSTVTDPASRPISDQDGLSPSAGPRASGPNSPPVTHELKSLIKRVMIKVADVINPARKTPLCVEWARRISEEYFAQTDEEKRLGLPVVMPHFDRNTCSMPKSQMTFIDYFLTDMCEAWHEFCGIEDVMRNLHDNYHYWKELQETGIMRLAELEDEKNSDFDLSTYVPQSCRKSSVESPPPPSSPPPQNESAGEVERRPVENHVTP